MVLTALHIASMFAAVTLLIGEALLYARALGRGNVSELATVRRLTGGRPLLGAVLLVLGIVFGFLTALTGGFDLTAGWLIAAYVLIVALFIVNGSPLAQSIPRLGQHALEAEAGQRPIAEVEGEMAAARPGVFVAATLNVLLFLAILFDMVLKPF